MSITRSKRRSIPSSKTRATDKQIRTAVLLFVRDCKKNGVYPSSTKYLKWVKTYDGKTVTPMHVKAHLGVKSWEDVLDSYTPSWKKTVSLNPPFSRVPIPNDEQIFESGIDLFRSTGSLPAYHVLARNLGHGYARAIVRRFGSWAAFQSLLVNRIIASEQSIDNLIYPVTYKPYLGTAFLRVDPETLDSRMLTARGMLMKGMKMKEVAKELKITRQRLHQLLTASIKAFQQQANSKTRRIRN